LLTYEDGTPLQRARGERWECRFAPGDDVELLAKRLVKRQKLAEAPAQSLHMPKMPPLGIV
jgi:hypothetical protein